MRRRHFIATLPLAAASPALAQDSPRPARPPHGGDAEGWAKLEAAPVTALASAPSRNVLVTGTATISSFGRAESGVTRLVRFSGETVLVHDRARLFVPNSGNNLLTAAGDVLTAVCQGGESWIVADYQPAGIVTKVDRRNSHGPLPYRYAIGSGADTQAPDFAVDGAYERTKVLMRSTFLIDPGDTPELGLFIADGTPAAPTPWREPYPGAFIYGWPRDATGRWGAQMGPGFRDSQWLGRNAQISFAIAGEPTPASRPGALVFGICPDGMQTPVDRGWFGPRGGFVLSGRALEGAIKAGRVSYPWAPRERQRKYHPVPGLNWRDYADDATLTLIASDTSDNKVLSVRRADDLSRGAAFDYLAATDELRLGRVAGGAFRAGWSWSAAGDQTPAADRGSSLGAPDRRVRTVYADTLNVSRATRGPAAAFRSEAPEPSGELVSLSAAHAGEGFSFLRASAGTGDHAHEAVRIDADGQARLAGGVLGQGRGVGAYMEWADGNPAGEDRVGWTVVLEDGRIRRARSSDPPHAVAGVVTARASVIADAAWSHWQGKHLTDDFGRPLTRPVEYVRWSAPVLETQPVHGARSFKERVRRPRRELVELTEDAPQLEEVDGRWIRRKVQTCRVVERPVVRTVALHAEDGSPALDDCGAPAAAEVPVFEDVEIERLERFEQDTPVELGLVSHCYPVHAVPAGLVAPPQAERIVVREKVLNPDYDPARGYRPREARPEWDVVAFAGPDRILKGEPVGERWIRVREISPQVEEWLVR